MASQINFNKLKIALKRSSHTILLRAGAAAVEFSKNNFVTQGWRDTAKEPWKKRAGNSGKGRAILVKTGRLKRSIRLVRITANTAVIATDVPYAGAHNNGYEGTVSIPQHTRNRYTKSKENTGVYSIKTRKEGYKTISSVTGVSTVKPYTRHMNVPRRRFMGKSMYLNNKIRGIINQELSKSKN